MNYLILLIAGLLLTVGASAGVGILMLGGLVLLAIGVWRVIARHKVNAARRAEQDEVRAWQLQQIRADQPAEPDWRYQPPHGWPHNQ